METAGLLGLAQLHSYRVTELRSNCICLARSPGLFLAFIFTVYQTLSSILWTWELQSHYLCKWTMNSGKGEANALNTVEEGRIKVTGLRLYCSHSPLIQFEHLSFSFILIHSLINFLSHYLTHESTHSFFHVFINLFFHS